MEVKIKHYTELSKEEFHDLIALRISVFVVEQDCPYQEVDGLDQDAYHLLVKEKNQIIGTLRMLKPGVQYPEMAIGRVASHPDHRERKMGHLMMEAAMHFLTHDLVQSTARLSAQSHLLGYYEKYNFHSTGKEYLEDGIPHTEMLFNGKA